MVEHGKTRMAKDGDQQMEQRDTESMRGPSNTPAGRRDTVSRDCRHRGSPHVHGTRAAYVSDRCGCIRCRAANRAAEEHRTAAIAVGRWNPYADAKPVQDHLGHLRRQGVSIERIAQLANVSIGTVRRLLNYSPDPAVPPYRTRAETARRLLALSPTSQGGSPRRLVAVDETRQRIGALMEAGHSLTELERLIGKPRASLRRSLTRQSVTAETATSVEALYRTLAQARPTGPKIPRTVRHFGETPGVGCHLGTFLYFVKGSSRSWPRALGLAESPGVSARGSQAFSKCTG